MQVFKFLNQMVGKDVANIIIDYRYPSKEQIKEYFLDCKKEMMQYNNLGYDYEDEDEDDYEVDYDYNERVTVWKERILNNYKFEKLVHFQPVGHTNCIYCEHVVNKPYGIVLK